MATEDDLMSMSDEDIMNMAQPPVVETEAEDEKETKQEQETNTPDPNENSDPEDDPSGSKEEPEEKEEEENPLNEADEDLDKKSKLKSENKSKEETPSVEKEEKEDKPDTQASTQEAPVVIDYKAGYEKIMAPFKASGRQMQVNSPEEVIALMQRGVDYTQKMQALQPNLKLMKMLENNGLLNAEKLSHFIDLEKKDPAAIAKFLKDKEVDPLDLDMSEETQYKPGNHTVSDEEMRFNSVLEDVQSTPTGRETIHIIDKQWDRTSQGRVFKEPQILKLIDTHREQGLYDQIVSEMDRLKLLGVIPENTVFLDAYKSVGDELHNNGRLLLNGVPTNQKKQSANPPVPEPNSQTTRKVIETRAPAPKPASRNAAAVRAAAPTRTSPTKPAVADFNPLALSDEEFEKQVGNFRL